MNLRKTAHCLLTVCILCAALDLSAQNTQLSQGWRFLTDPQARYSPSELPAAERADWRPVLVDRSWNAQFDDLRDYMGVAWYRVSFDVPRFETPRHALLRFGAVDYLSEVWVNGKPVCKHEGGYTPFACDASSAVHPGANELIVRVIDPPRDEKPGTPRFPDMRYNAIPHGKQNWYVQTGGIWQPVVLEFRPSTYIEQVHVTPQIDGKVRIEAFLAGDRRTGHVAYIIRDKAGAAVASGLTEATEGVAKATAQVNGPELWTTSSPALYTVEVSLNGGEDLRRERFGFRKFEARDGKLFLNGEPFYMVAALDQDFYPETIYTPPSKEYVRNQMMKGKQMGLNLLRCHIKVCDPQYLEAADEVGMLVWYEIPSWFDGAANFSPEAAQRGERIFAEMVERDWNHPAIVVQSVINESWGANLKDADQRHWLREAFDRSKGLTAPLGRLIVDNSACCDNFHLKTDLDDFHQYFSIPDNFAKWDKWTSEFASRPKWTFSPHGDGVRTGKEPLIVSEFGNWGLPKLPASLPWWFSRDFNGNQLTRPAGLFERFADYKFTRLYSTYNDLAEATQWHQFESLKHEIEDMRQHGSIQGYVITEFTDINWEANGLMDMSRNPKVYAGRLAQIQQPDLILAQLPQRNYASGDLVHLRILASHYGPSDWQGARVRWSTQSGAAGEFAMSQPPARGTVAQLRAISLPAPTVATARKEWISLEVVSATGAILAQNLYDIYVYPARQVKTRPIHIAIHDPRNALLSLAPALRKSGYVLTDKPAAHDLLISSVLDTAVDQHLDNGGRALLLLDSTDALPKNSAISMKAREGSEFDGNWVTNFNWIDTKAVPFRNVAFGNILGFEAAEVTPHYVLQNVPSSAYDDVLAGIFYGWLNNNSALMFQARRGKGALLATTLRFSRYPADLYSANLLDGLFRYVASADFNPNFVWQSTQSSTGQSQ